MRRRPDSTITQEISVARHRTLLCAVFSVLSMLGSIDVPLRAEERVIRKTVFEGQELSYEVIDGRAIHDGDIVLGTAEEVASTLPRLQLADSATDTWSEPQAAASAKLGTLWPEGIIPYVIDDTISETAVPTILGAIEEWNAKTVITLVERTTQRNYVRFKFYPSHSNCASFVGMVGGEQEITLAEWCTRDRSAVIHEIGHAAGLMHEHQRKDRDRYLMLNERGLDYLWNWPYSTIDHGTLNHGPYDFASIMHYMFPRNRMPHDTIPPGIPIRDDYSSSATLSAGDIDGVARLYGQPPAKTTISTNPPGLDIIVDGQRVTTPASFDWDSGSEHRIEAPSPQMGPNGFRFVFGRWTDDGRRDHVVTADPDTTWHQASFILQRPIIVRAKPEAAGRVSIETESPDGFYTLGSRFVVSAETDPESSYRFRKWGVRNGDPNYNDGSNPTAMTVSAQADLPPLGTTTVTGWFEKEDKSCILIDSNVDAPIFVQFANRPSAIGIEGSHSVDLPNRLCGSSPLFIQAHERAGLWNPTSPYTFYQFLSWSDGGPIGHWINPSEGGKLTLNVATYHAIRVESLLGSSWHVSDQIDLSPPPEKISRGAPPGISRGSPNTFYAEGTRVQMKANAKEGFRFVGWGGSVSGTDPVKSLVMDGFQGVKGFFARGPQFPVVQPGKRERFSAAGRPAVSSRIVYVPPGSTELAIEIELDNPRERVVLGIGPEPSSIALDSKGRVETDWADALSFVRAGSARILVTSETTPWFSGNRAYLIAVAAERGRIGGTMMVTLKGGPPVQAHPRAFTFVSPQDVDPLPQRFRLTNVGDEALHYRIGSSQEWLTTDPERGYLDEGDSAEITVVVSSRRVAPETHTGKLTVVRRNTITTGPESSGGVGIPVTFASSSQRRLHWISLISSTGTPSAPTWC